MAEVDAKVLAMVERALKKDPELKSTELQKRAVKIDQAVRNLTGRQFHARYALQARKKLFGGSRARPKAPRRRKTAGGLQSNPALALLSDSYEEKKAALDQAVNEAFERAIQTDSVSRINELLAYVDRETRGFQKL